MDIDHDTSTQRKPVWGQRKKKSLRGTSNSHNPKLTWTSAQSGAALKVRGDASTYINHEWSHHKKNSNAHERQSASVCKHFFQHFLTKASIRFFLSVFFCCFSWFICFVFRCVAGYPVKEDLRAFVHSWFFISSFCVCTMLKLLWVNIHLA